MLSTSTWRRTSRTARRSPSRRRTSRATLVPSAPWSRLAASSRLSPFTAWPAIFTTPSPVVSPPPPPGPPPVTPTRRQPPRALLRPIPRLPRGAAADHADQAQARRVALQLDPQPHEVAVDHRVQVFELVGRQVAGEIVERVAGPAGELQEHGRRRHAEGLVGQVAGRPG